MTVTSIQGQMRSTYNFTVILDPQSQKNIVYDPKFLEMVTEVTMLKLFIENLNNFNFHFWSDHDG